MGEEIDRMMEHKRRAIVFLVLFFLAISIIITILIVMGTGDYSGTNDEFAHIEARGEIDTRTYGFGKVESLMFFYDGHRAERTLFTDAVPKVKIVNSDRYAVEVKTNRELLDILEVGSKEDVLRISFPTSYYGVVSSPEGSYRNGLYVDCDEFEMTVYAPISQLFTSAEIVLDYQAPKTDFMRIFVVGELQDSRVYDVDTVQLNCVVCGETDVSFSGQVTGEASFSAYHNSKIDAQALTVPKVSTDTTSQIFGFSVIDGNGYFECSAISLGYFLSWLLVLFPVTMAVLFTLFIVKYLRLKKKIDSFIERDRERKNVTEKRAEDGSAVSQALNGARKDSDNTDEKMKNSEKN